jgi:hypothetical protein
MRRAMFRRSFPILALIGLLAVPAGAAPWLSQRGAARPAAVGSISGQIFEWLTLAWTRYGGSAHALKARGFNGCIADPNGSCAPGASTQSDNGCTLDPGGHCATAATTQVDGGCIADPNGFCLH